MKYIPPNLEKTEDISRGHSSLQTWIKNTLSILIILGTAYWALGWVAGWMALHIPEKYEAKLNLFETKPPKKDDAIYPNFQRAQKTFKKLLDHANLRELPYQLYWVDTEDINAFAFPGGKVAVTSGLLQKVSSEAGLAMVLGHELGHHQHRHALQRIGRTLIYQLASTLLFGSHRPSLAEASLQMGELRYNRNQEKQADHYGLELVQQTYGNTKDSLEFFEILAQEQKDTSTWRTLFSTHPLTEERLKYLREWNQGPPL